MRLPTSLEGAGGVGGVHAYLETAGEQVDQFALDIALLVVIQSGWPCVLPERRQLEILMAWHAARPLSLCFTAYFDFAVT